MADSGKVLLTGASGFVGSAVARALVQRGFAVRAIVRPSSPTRHLDGLALEFSHGDLRDADAVRLAMRGVRYVFHVAADYRLWARDPNEIAQSNVLGTRHVMEAARRAGVERIVHTSTVATLRYGRNGEPADETRPLGDGEAIGAYTRSKLAAERMVEVMVGEGLPAVIVNPSAPVGPCDVKPTPTGRMILQAACGRMPAFVDTGLNMVHVDDVADGHLAAFVHGRIGERYILGGQNASLAEILATVAAECGRRPPRIRIPHAAAMSIAVVAEAIARRNGREPLVTRDGLRMSKRPMYVTAAKAERELGYRARPYAEAVRDAVEWFRRAGYMR